MALVRVTLQYCFLTLLMIEHFGTFSVFMVHQTHYCQSIMIFFSLICVLGDQHLSKISKKVSKCQINLDIPTDRNELLEPKALRQIFVIDLKCYLGCPNAQWTINVFYMKWYHNGPHKTLLYLTKFRFLSCLAAGSFIPQNLPVAWFLSSS